MCEHCTIDVVEEINNAAKEKADEASKGKTFNGIIGSVLFSIIGVALYFVLYYFLSPAISQSNFSDIRYIFCISGFVVSLLAYFGFRIFSKKISSVSYIVIAVNSLFFTAIGQYIGVVFEFVAKNGFKLSVLSNKHFWLVHLRNTIPQDLAEHFISNSEIFWKLLAISLMFAAIGTGIFLLSLHDKATLKPESVEIETVSLN
jgi:hypothetical protein